MVDLKILLTKMLDAMYPVGSIYISTNNVSPATFFGGTWVQIKGRFLLGTGAPDDNTNAYWGTNLTYDGANKYDENAKSKGGESLHTLITYEMPSHTHKGMYSSGDGQNAGMKGVATNNWYADGYNEATGGGGAHNNMPPYYVVYMWERTA